MAWYLRENFSDAVAKTAGLVASGSAYQRGVASGGACRQGLKNLLQKILKNLQKLLLAKKARCFLRNSLSRTTFRLLNKNSERIIKARRKVVTHKPREVFKGTDLLAYKSLWKGVWGVTFLQSLSRSRTMRDYE